MCHCALQLQILPYKYPLRLFSHSSYRARLPVLKLVCLVVGEDCVKKKKKHWQERINSNSCPPVLPCKCVLSHTRNKIWVGKHVFPSESAVVYLGFRLFQSKVMQFPGANPRSCIIAEALCLASCSSLYQCCAPAAPGGWTL